MVVEKRWRCQGGPKHASAGQPHLGGRAETGQRGGHGSGWSSVHCVFSLFVALLQTTANKSNMLTHQACYGTAALGQTTRCRQRRRSLPEARSLHLGNRSAVDEASLHALCSQLCDWLSCRCKADIPRGVRNKRACNAALLTPCAAALAMRCGRRLRTSLRPERCKRMTGRRRHEPSDHRAISQPACTVALPGARWQWPSLLVREWKAVGE